MYKLSCIIRYEVKRIPKQFNKILVEMSYKVAHIHYLKQHIGLTIIVRYKYNECMTSWFICTGGPYMFQ